MFGSQARFVGSRLRSRDASWERLVEDEKKGELTVFTLMAHFPLWYPAEAQQGVRNIYTRSFPTVYCVGVI